jgi:putative flippase GtrA
LASAGGFLVSNLVAYAINVSWIFEGGRHARFQEFLYFTGISAAGFGIGLALGTAEILHGSGSSWMASLFLVVSSTLVNFVTRKFFIFRG